jgi:hypothetical protein
MKSVSHKLVADILIKRGYYNMMPARFTQGLAVAAARFISDAAAEEAMDISRTDMLKVAVLQCHLKLSGFDPGPIDGFLGPSTLYAYGFWRAKLTGGELDFFKDDEISPSPVWPLEKDVNEFYGEKGTRQTKVHCPYPLRIAWDVRTKVEHITIHEKCADSLTRILDAILKEYGKDKIEVYGLNLFGGSLNVRLKRGSATQWSIHSWGAAIDWDPAHNQLRWGRDQASLAQPHLKAFWEIWEAGGWLSLGRARNYDWMHVQAARL